MMETIHDVTDAELAVLRQLWEQGPQTRRQLTDALYPEGGPAHYTTVQKLLERLEAKQFVQSEMHGHVRSFQAIVERDALIRNRLQNVADKLCEGSLTPLLLNLVESKPVSAEELAELRALVRRLGKGSSTADSSN
jgi:BlaI family transcriptional regulator, penicillinase repressor